jgi:chromate reductase
MNIVGIAGSLRKGSYNRLLLKNAQSLLPEGVSLEIADLDDIPFFSEDVEALGDPPAVEWLKSLVRSADALLIATPEYNAGIPGVLKNALDWLSRGDPSALFGKPVAVVGASPSRFGTARAQMSLLPVLVASGAVVMSAPGVMVSEVYSKFDDEGVLEPESAAMLSQALRGLVEWASRFNTVEEPGAVAS